MSTISRADFKSDEEWRAHLIASGFDPDDSGIQFVAGTETLRHMSELNDAIESARREGYEAGTKAEYERIVAILWARPVCEHSAGMFAAIERKEGGS